MSDEAMVSTSNDDDDDDDDDGYDEGNDQYLHPHSSAYSPLAHPTRSAHKNKATKQTTTPAAITRTPATASVASRHDAGDRRALDDQINSLTQQLSAAGAYMTQLSGRLTDLEGQGQGLGQGQGQGLGLSMSSPHPSKVGGPAPSTNPFQLATTLQTPDNYNNNNSSSAVFGNQSFLQASITRTETRAETGPGTDMSMSLGHHHQLGMDVVGMNRDLYFEKSR